jgi:D-alanine-D-alanine ligase
MKTGETFVSALRGARVRDVVMKRDGSCVLNGRVVSFPQACLGADVVINALHGKDGEAGDLQTFCTREGVCFTGVTGVGGNFTLHKALARDMARSKGVPFVPFILIESAEAVPRGVEEAVRLFGQPIVVKPVRGAGGEGVAILEGVPSILAEAEEQFQKWGDVLLEPYMRGSVAHVFLLEDFRGDKRYVLPIVEVARLGNDWHTRCPAELSNEEMHTLSEYARALFDLFMLRHYGQVKFLVSPRRIQFMEVNALPRVGGGALFSKSLDLAGITPEAFANHIVSLAER